MDIDQITSLMTGISKALDNNKTRMEELSKTHLTSSEIIAYREMVELLAPLSGELMFLHSQLKAERDRLVRPHNRFCLKKIKF